ncbi:MAG TPA: Kdo hydroxylase family protein [Caulobacteraceae bacterium]|nr:Kdo hydroxylase family protein [Caulobacteraceae bacterium]
MNESGFAQRLEREGLVILDDERFDLTAEERALLSTNLGDGKAKNISLAPGAHVRGARAGAAQEPLLEALLVRYAAWARDLVVRMAPAYASSLETGRTSFRPRAIDDAPISPRKDDRRLHVDAFASQPTGGRRILRVFCNINPAGEDRIWRVGEPFEEHARRWTSKARLPLPGGTALLQAVGITRGRRTPYDALMLQLHDRAKLDPAYQADAPRREIRFPPGCVWIVFTDSTAHAAIAGRYALEQTFYLPLSAMAAPEVSPVRILERLTGKKLVPA